MELRSDAWRGESRGGCPERLGGGDGEGCLRCH